MRLDWGYRCPKCDGVYYVDRATNEPIEKRPAIRHAVLFAGCGLMLVFRNNLAAMLIYATLFGMACLTVFLLFGLEGTATVPSLPASLISQRRKLRAVGLASILIDGIVAAGWLVGAIPGYLALALVTLPAALFLLYLRKMPQT